MLRDMQDVPPKGYCIRCGGELYQYDDDFICRECMEEDDEAL